MINTDPIKTTKASLSKDQRFQQLTEKVSICFVKIPTQTFIMGSNPNLDIYAFSNEFPEHSVTLHDYWISKYPITNAQYKVFIQETGHNSPFHWKNNEIPNGIDDHPVTYVNWMDATAFCYWLGQKIKVSVCLPSEAEWEFAARGMETDNFWPKNIMAFQKFINFDRGFLSRGSSVVGLFSPPSDSPFGVSDMLGNIWEWTSDWYDQNYYQTSPLVDPLGPQNGSSRVIRGGSWIDEITECRPTHRQGLDPKIRNSYTGFRICLSKTHSLDITQTINLRSQVNKAITEQDWINASQLVEKLASLSDDDINIFQNRIGEGQLLELKKKIVRIVRMRSLQLRINQALEQKDWDQVISASQELISLEPNNPIAHNALLVTQKHLVHQKILGLRLKLVYIIDLHKLDLEIEELIKNQVWEKAKEKTLEYIQKSGSSTRSRSLLELIYKEMEVREKKSTNKKRLTAEAQVENARNSIHEKFQEALIAENWELVIKYGEEWISESPNIYVISSVEKAKKKLKTNLPTNTQSTAKPGKFIELQQRIERAIAENRLEEARNDAFEWQRLFPLDPLPKKTLNKVEALLEQKKTPAKPVIDPVDSTFNDVFSKLKEAVLKEDWSTACRLGEIWIQLNMKNNQANFENDTDLRTNWRKFSPLTIDLIKAGKLLPAVVVGSIAIYYSQNSQNTENILNAIWKKFISANKTALPKNNYEILLKNGKWYEILEVMRCSLTGIVKESSKIENIKKTPERKVERTELVSGSLISQTNSFLIFNSASFLSQKATSKQPVSIDITSKISLSFTPISEGESYIGSWPADQTFKEETPGCTIHFPGYWISEFTITNKQFSYFVEKTGYITTAERMNSWYTRINRVWKDFPGVSWKYPHGKSIATVNRDDFPVTMVSWYDAIEFCKWLESLTNLKVQLPSEAEWERAARGNRIFDYPWGDKIPNSENCNFGNSSTGDTKPVNLYSPNGDSPFGCKNMAGNVWEWTTSLYKPYPYIATDGREDSLTKGNRVIRGGAFISPANDLRCSARKPMEPEKRSCFLGFRVVIHSGGN